MKKTVFFLLPIAAITMISASLDISSLENYGKQTTPAYIRKDNTPATNQIEDKGATLGRVLFYDKKLSVNNSTACASCHQQQFSFGDTASASQGAKGITERHAMRLVNARFGTERKFFWDERAASLEEQTTMPIQNHNEMGFSGQNGDPGFQDLITKMNGIWYYPELFAWVYGDAEITESRIQLALAKFVRSIQSFDSKFDTGRAMVRTDGQPFPNFTNEENQGKQLFLVPPQFDNDGNRIAGGAGCGGCHGAPEFDIIPNSGNNGVTGSFSGGADVSNTRSPSLRNVVDVNGSAYGGFMHNAGANDLRTLLDVINHYDSIPANNPNLDNKLRPGGKLQRLHLTAQEKAALVAFIRTLSGSDIITNSKWSDPFVGDSLNITHLPTYVRNDTKNFKIKVYPTVVEDWLTIEMPNLTNDINMRIVNSEGRVLYNGTTTEKFNMTTYVAGIYLIKFSNGQVAKVLKR